MSLRCIHMNTPIYIFSRDIHKKIKYLQRAYFKQQITENGPHHFILPPHICINTGCLDFREGVMASLTHMSHNQKSVIYRTKTELLFIASSIQESTINTSAHRCKALVKKGQLNARGSTKVETGDGCTQPYPQASLTVNQYETVTCSRYQKNKRKAIYNEGCACVCVCLCVCV